MSIPKVSRRLIPDIDQARSRRQPPVLPKPDLRLPALAATSPNNMDLLTVRQKLNLLSHIKELTDHFKAMLHSSALHQFLSNELALPRLNTRIKGLTGDQAETIMRIVSDALNTNRLRQAFVVKNSVDFFSEINKGAAQQLTAEEMGSLFVDGQVASSVVAVSKQGEAEAAVYQILFRDGNIRRSRQGIDQINVRKKWQVAQTELTPLEFQRMFFSQLIDQQEQAEIESVANSLYIRCSDEAANKLRNGHSLEHRTWLSFSQRYSDNFRNKAKADSAQGNLIRINVGVNSYLDMLARFNEQIRDSQLEGIHRLRQSRPELIAKMERNAPNVAIEDFSLLGEFTAEKIEPGN